MPNDRRDKANGVAPTSWSRQRVTGNLLCGGERILRAGFTAMKCTARLATVSSKSDSARHPLIAGFANGSLGLPNQPSLMRSPISPSEAVHDHRPTLFTSILRRRFVDTKIAVTLCISDDEVQRPQKASDTEGIR